MNKVFIVVEGVADEVFLSQLIQERKTGDRTIRLAKDRKANIKLEIESETIEVSFIRAETNGVSIKSVKIKEILTKTSSLEHKTLFILDADAPNFGDTKKSLIKNFKSEDLDIPEENIFLLPNNEHDGCLEDLLIQIVSNKADPIFECFEAYKECIHTIDQDYTKPDLKTKIYAYSEILTSSGSERTRAYSDSEIWDLNNNALDPLVKFLNHHLT